MVDKDFQNCGQQLVFAGHKFDANTCVQPAVKNRVGRGTANCNQVTSDEYEIELIRIEIDVRSEVDIDVEKVPWNPRDGE